jgi:hypothetical protein
LSNEDWDKMEVLYVAKGYEEGCAFARKSGRVPTTIEFVTLKAEMQRDFAHLESIPNEGNFANDKRRLKGCIDVHWKSYEKGCRDTLDAISNALSPAVER